MKSFKCKMKIGFGLDLGRLWVGFRQTSGWIQYITLGLVSVCISHYLKKKLLLEFVNFKLKLFKKHEDDVILKFPSYKVSIHPQIKKLAIQLRQIDYKSSLS